MTDTLVETKVNVRPLIDAVAWAVKEDRKAKNNSRSDWYQNDWIYVNTDALPEPDEVDKPITTCGSAFCVAGRIAMDANLVKVVATGVLGYWEVTPHLTDKGQKLVEQSNRRVDIEFDEWEMIPRSVEAYMNIPVDDYGMNEDLNMVFNGENSIEAVVDFARHFIEAHGTVEDLDIFDRVTA